jgi:hypothetical protein
MAKSLGCPQFGLSPSIAYIAGYSGHCRLHGNGQCHATWSHFHENAGTFSLGGSMNTLEGFTSELCKDGDMLLQHKRCYRIIDFGHLKAWRLNLCSSCSISPGNSLWRGSAGLCVNGCCPQYPCGCYAVPSSRKLHEEVLFEQPS